MEKSRMDNPETLARNTLKIPKGYSESYIEKEQTTQWPKEKVQKDKQRSTKHYI
jgi:hypothetical protein